MKIDRFINITVQTALALTFIFLFVTIIRMGIDKRENNRSPAVEAIGEIK